MFEPQHFFDLQENSGCGEPKSWLSGDDNLSPTQRPNQSSLVNSTTSHSTTNGNVDRVLFNDLVEMVPLIESLIDRKASSSFTRRGSIIYTKTPSRESLSRKATDPNGRNAAQSIHAKMKRDHGDNDRGKNASGNQVGDNLILSSRASTAEREELIALREQVEDLQRKLLEKDELLKSAEISKNQMNIKLADKQAALEKLQWEAMTSNRKVEKLQEKLDSVQGEIWSFMQLFEGLMNNDHTKYSEDYDITPYHFDHLLYLDDLDEMEMHKMEEAREAYIAAVATARERQDEESVVAAASARLFLQSFVFRSQNIHTSNDFSRVRISQAPSEAFSCSTFMYCVEGPDSRAIKVGVVGPSMEEVCVKMSRDQNQFHYAAEAKPCTLMKSSLESFHHKYFILEEYEL